LGDLLGNVANEVQRYPTGLLDVLGIKGGRPPNMLRNDYGLTIPALRILARQGSQLQSTTNAAAAQGTGIDVLVPAGQTWLLTEGNVQITEAAAMTLVSASLQLRYGGSAFTINYGRWGIPFNVGGLLKVPYYFSEPVVLVAGDGVSAGLDTLAGVATANVTVLARFALVS